MLDQSAPRWRRRKDARPQEITAAALDVFVERGFAAARLDEIAAKAGVTKGTLYLYFASKEDLMMAVISAAIEPNLEQIRHLIESHDGPFETLYRGAIKAMFTTMIDAPIAKLPRLMVAEATNFPDVARHLYEHGIAKVLALHAEVVRRGIARGEFRAVDVDMTALLIQSQILFLALWTHALGPATGQTLDLGRYLDSFFDILFAGLRPQAHEAP